MKYQKKDLWVANLTAHVNFFFLKKKNGAGGDGEEWKLLLFINDIVI